MLKMPTTMDLLELALENGNPRVLSRALGLSDEALATARHRGRLSPLLAGTLAKELGQDPAKWIVIAVLENERESASRTTMLRFFRKQWRNA
ncbi:hypothetical protein J7E62_20795 [Variovorax paradoxus]|nr:hypothetical protein [Variovorax paradoxus]